MKITLWIVGLCAAATICGQVNIGYQSGVADFTEGTNVARFGYQSSADWILGTNVVRFMRPEPTNVIAIGLNALQMNMTNSNLLAVGVRAGQTNRFSNVVILGRDLHASKDNEIVVRLTNGKIMRYPLPPGVWIDFGFTNPPWPE
jgi:hypothetical protein